MPRDGMPICGHNAVLPARFVGCGAEIKSWGEVYRCTHCDVAFHKGCALRHFASDAVLTKEMVESMTAEEVRIAENALREKE